MLTLLKELIKRRKNNKIFKNCDIARKGFGKDDKKAD